MTTRARADELVEQLVAAGIKATTDPRAAHPPCVLATPPARTYDVNTEAGYSAEWVLWALAPAPGSAASWDKLDELVDAVASVLDVERAEPGSYQLPATSPGVPVPAYRITTAPEAQ